MNGIDFKVTEVNSRFAIVVTWPMTRLHSARMEPNFTNRKLLIILGRLSVKRGQSPPRWWISAIPDGRRPAQAIRSPSWVNHNGRPLLYTQKIHRRRLASV
jgi:hypothetical protein